MRQTLTYIREKISVKAKKNNTVYVWGEMEGNFVYSHTLYGRKFYRARLIVTRFSGTNDFIPIMVSEKLIDTDHDYSGDYVSVEGEMRSRNRHDYGKNHLDLYLLAKEIEIEDFLCSENIIYLDGYLCKKPVYRVTPLGREISEVILAVNRDYGASYIPCICWFGNAREIVNFDVGTRIKLYGRVQSRSYQKKVSDTEIKTRTAYEVSVSEMEVVDETGNCGKKADGSGDPGADDGAGHVGGCGNDAGGFAMEECEMGRGTL